MLDGIHMLLLSQSNEALDLDQMSEPDMAAASS